MANVPPPTYISSLIIPPLPPRPPIVRYPIIPEGFEDITFTTLQDSQGDSVLKIQSSSGATLRGAEGTARLSISGNSQDHFPTQGSTYMFSHSGVTWQQSTITSNGLLPFPMPDGQINADGTITNNQYRKSGDETIAGDINGDGIIGGRVSVAVTGDEFNAKRDSLGLVDAVRDDRGQILINDVRNVDVAGQKPGDPNPVTPQATVAEAPAALAVDTPPAAEAIVADPVVAAPTPAATVEEAPPTPEVEPEVVTLA